MAYTPQVGETVKAFHPLRFGVISYGRVEKVGRRWVHVRFAFPPQTLRVRPDHIVGSGE